MNKVFKYGFVVAVAFIITSQFFNGRDKKTIKDLELSVAQKEGFIDSLVLSAKHHQLLVLELQDEMLFREDSFIELQRVDIQLLTNYEKKIAANRYRTVAEFEGYLSNRYPKRQRSDSAQVESGANH